MTEANEVKAEEIKDQTVLEAWQRFKRDVLTMRDKPLNEKQLEIARLYFYSGAVALFSMMTRFARTYSIDGSEGPNRMKALREEFVVFLDEVAKKEAEEKGESNATD